MAAQVRLIRLTWENGVSFKMDTKLDAESYVTILEMDENGNIAQLWASAQQLCEKYFEATITGVGNDMKA